MKKYFVSFTALFLALSSVPAFCDLPDGVFLDKWMDRRFCAEDSTGHGMNCQKEQVFHCNKYNEKFSQNRSLFFNINNYLRTACNEDKTSIFSHITGISAINSSITMVRCEIGYIHPTGVLYANIRCVPAPNYSKTEHEQCEKQTGCKFQQYEDSGSATYKCECNNSSTPANVVASGTVTNSAPVVYSDDDARRDAILEQAENLRKPAETVEVSEPMKPVSTDAATKDNFDFMAAQSAEAPTPAAWENTSPSAQPVEENEEAVTTGDRSAYTAYNPLTAGNQTETESSSSYTPQKPFIRDNAIKQQFRHYKNLTGTAKTENDSEFEEWQRACKEIGLENNVATFKLVKNAEDNNMIIYNCVADTCKKEGYIASKENLVCTEESKQTKNLAEERTKITTAIKAGIKLGDKITFKKDFEDKLKETLNEWDAKCKEVDVSKIDQAATTGYKRSALASNVTYTCELKTCKDGFEPDNSGQKCKKTSEQKKKEKKEEKATTELEKQYEKDIDELISAHEAVVKKYVKECTSKGGDIQDGACSK